MKSDNIGTTKRRKKMLLNQKHKDSSIYYYGPESKYISNTFQSKSRRVTSLLSRNTRRRWLEFRKKAKVHWQGQRQACEDPACHQSAFQRWQVIRSKE